MSAIILVDSCGLAREEPSEPNTAYHHVCVWFPTCHSTPRTVQFNHVTTISLYLTRLYVTKSFAIGSPITYSEIRQNLSNSAAPWGTDKNNQHKEFAEKQKKEK